MRALTQAARIPAYYQLNVLHCAMYYGVFSHNILFVTEQQADYGKAAAGAHQQLPKRTEGVNFRCYEERREYKT